MLPHLLHYIALLGGTALVSAAGGSALFFVVGLAFSLPMLRRLYRRFHSWVAPAIALAVFAALFSMSAFLIGPAIAGGSSSASTGPFLLAGVVMVMTPVVGIHRCASA